MSSFDRYGPDVLATDWRAPKRGRATEVTLEIDMVLEEVTTDFCGAVVRFDRDLGTVDLEDRRGKRRTFPLGPGFLLEGKPVIVRAPKRKTPGTTPGTTPGKPPRTASGSVAVEGVAARVARASRIFVEGRHDAELVEKVWGDDLRIEGVVVEYLDGVDDLAEIVAEHRPTPSGRLGVLVDHLVPGSKEQRIADAVHRGPHGDSVLVVGHPYVDIWQAIKPDRAGLSEWPAVPRSVPWKHGICQALGWPHRDQADIARAWQRLLSTVESYADLEPALLGRVEELIDFVTET